MGKAKLGRGERKRKGAQALLEEQEKNSAKKTTKTPKPAAKNAKEAAKNADNPKVDKTPKPAVKIKKTKK